MSPVSYTVEILAVLNKV